jgi:dethiobiotin synthase
VLFVLGSRDAVGKTLVAMTLLRLADKLGIAAAGMKPVQTGCPYTEDHDLWARDGDVLRASVRRPLAPLVTSPYRFPTPGAPAAAARRAGLRLTLEDLEAVVRSADEAVDLLVVEGTGGIDTEIAEDGTTAAFAARLGARIVLVADGDDDLDAALAKIPAEVAGVILTRVDHSDDPRVIAVLPPLDDGGRDAVELFERANVAEALLRHQVER